jgi:hypothetical protein
MKIALQSISKAVALSTVVATLMVGAGTRAAQAKEWQANVGAQTRDLGIRLWPFCRMSFGFMSATASVGHSPPMRSIR